MFAATAVTVQFAALGRSEPGSSVIELVPEPLTPNVCALLSHEIVNELVVTSTGSLKFTVMFADGSTSVALSAGVVVGRSLSGSSVIPDVPEPLTWKVCGLPSQTIVNELESTVTASLKVNVMFVFAATSVAPSAGEWAVTAGAESVVKENE